MNEDTDQIVHISMTGVDGGEGRRRALGVEGEGGEGGYHGEEESGAADWLACSE